MPACFVPDIRPGCPPPPRGRCRPTWINTALHGLRLSQMLCKAERGGGGGRKSPECPAPDLAPMKTRGLSRLLRRSQVRLQGQREAKHYWEGLSVPFPRRSVQVPGSATLHHRIFAPFFGTSPCQRGRRSSAAPLQDLSCRMTDRAHPDKGFASKSAGLDTKLCQLYSGTEPLPTWQQTKTGKKIKIASSLRSVICVCWFCITPATGQVS